MSSEGTSTLDQYSIFAAYDLAVRDWITHVTSKLSSDIVIVSASPMRAFGEASRVIERSSKSGQPPTNRGDKNAKVPLPLISVERGSISGREQRHFNAPLNHGLPLYDEGKKQAYSIRAATPITIPYQLDIWSKTKNVQSKIIKSILDAFDPFMSYGIVSLNESLQNIWMPIKLGDMSDSSELEGGDSEDRVIRNTLSIDIEGWNAHRYEQSDTVQEVTTSFEYSKESIEVKNVPRFKGLFVQTSTGEWLECHLHNLFKRNMVHSEPPPSDEIELPTKLYTFCKNGIQVKSSDGHFYHLFWNSKSEQFDVRRVSVADIGFDKILTIPFEQKVVIGSIDDNIKYGEMRFNTMGHVWGKERYLTIN